MSRPSAPAIRISDCLLYTSDTFRNLLEQQLALLGIPVTIMAVEELWQEEETLSERLAAENLQEDLEKDPVLLYGKLFSGSRCV